MASSTRATVSFSNPSRCVVVLSHIAVSVLVAAAVSILVFSLWFPNDLRELSGGGTLFWWIVCVDVVCGPILTFVLYKQHKSRNEISFDLALIAAIQISAMAYGVHTLALARPLALVFEIDRFRVVSSADILDDELKYAPDWFNPWTATSIRTLGIRPPSSKDEQFESFDAALQGVDAGRRPQRWQAYALSHPQVRARARAIAELHAIYKDDGVLISKSAAAAIANQETGETSEPEKLLWLPVVSRRSLDWVVLIDPITLRVRGYVPLDGFK